MRADVCISGVGVVAAVGQGKAEFLSALLRGDHAFRVMQRDGRQRDSAFIGAEIDSLHVPKEISPRLLRNASLPAQAAFATLHEAWHDARLDDVDPQRIGLVIGGSNLQQRDRARLQDEFASRFKYVPPAYGLSFIDSDLCGLCTQQFAIRGLAHTVGAASASGQVAVMQAASAVASGDVDVCIAIGALTDVSAWECQALRSLGAMGSDAYADRPPSACRPFDSASDGFVYGEACAAVVLESGDAARKRGAATYARVAGWATVIDGNRGTDPSLAGECKAIANALERAGVAPSQIDYINPHGTGAPLGDATEANAIRTSGLAHAFINTTKSITGHGLTSAGAVEIVATVLQMREGMLHPSRNLDSPIDPTLNWVRSAALPHTIHRALTLSIGFGGINTAMCLSRASD